MGLSRSSGNRLEQLEASLEPAPQRSTNFQHLRVVAPDHGRDPVEPVGLLPDDVPDDALIAAVAKARMRAGLSQAELAKRMKTTQSTVARLESGRGKPSTRTLQRFAKATGHKLKITFEPLEKAKKRARR